MSCKSKSAKKKLKSFIKLWSKFAQHAMQAADGADDSYAVLGVTSSAVSALRDLSFEASHLQEKLALSLSASG